MSVQEDVMTLKSLIHRPPRIDEVSLEDSEDEGDVNAMEVDRVSTHLISDMEALQMLLDQSDRS